MELFLPLTFVVAQAHLVNVWISIFGLVWCGVFTLFPLFNADRLRIGDLVAGTWVVRVPRRLLGSDLVSPLAARIVFNKAALDTYGIHELAVGVTSFGETMPAPYKLLQPAFAAK